VEKLSYLSTFVSLIYGLGVANVLAHVAALIKRGRQADWYWVHTLWTFYLLLMMATFWWLLQNWANVPKIGFVNYLSLLLIPSFLFIASDLLFPERGGEGTVDLKAHFFRIKKPLFLIMLGVLVSDQIDTVQKGWAHVIELGPLYWSTQVYWYVVTVVGIRSRNEAVQGAIVVFGVAIFVATTINALAFV
jgi:hypothetical protein